MRAVTHADDPARAAAYWSSFSRHPAGTACEDRAYDAARDDDDLDEQFESTEGLEDE